MIEMMSRGSMTMLVRLGERVCEDGVADGHDGGEGEEEPDTIFRPNPAADGTCENGDEMVDGDTRGHRGG